MKEASYGYHKNLGKVSVEQATARVTAALATEGFGIVTEMNVAETLRKKINVDIRPYRILGACNPGLAHAALQAEEMIGLLLPCNVVVFEREDGTVNVSLARPSSMFQIVDNPDIRGLASEVDAKIQRVLERL
ncbi:MAG: DUF302 domain-containing protein [Myxococcota bacterium]|nr:DUF302 domain-containing protein [Myxococcota bacterium]